MRLELQESLQSILNHHHKFMHIKLIRISLKNVRLLVCPSGFVFHTVLVESSPLGFEGDNLTVLSEINLVRPPIF